VSGVSSAGTSALIGRSALTGRNATRGSWPVVQ
jgi:hypothetical protein